MDDEGRPLILPRRLVTAALAFAAYGALGVAALWPTLPGQSGRMAQCGCGDPALSTWFLGWVPYALLHGHNPFFSASIDIPAGVNLAQNTAMPLLGLVAAPVTLLAGPISSYNLLLFLAFPLSAGSMFIALRRWTGAGLPAFIGGLIYGFSPFLTGQGIDHPMFSFAPLPPLILLLVYELLVQQTGDPYRQGALLGLVTIGQFFIEPEVLADMAVVLALGLVILVITARGSVTSAMVGFAGRGLAVAAALVVIVVAYPVWFMEAGPQHFTGPVQPLTNPYRSDLLGPVVPTGLERLDPSRLLRAGERITLGGSVQNNSYIGLPLLILALAMVVRFRRDRWILFSAAMAAIAFILSLGPTLVANGHRTGLLLPFALVAKVPLLDNILPARFSLIEDLFVSVTVSLGFAHILRRPPPAHPERPPRRRGAPRPARTIGLVMVLAAVSLVPLVPGWPYHTVPSDVPRFFRSSEARRIPTGSLVLTYPFPQYPDDQAMLWQAVTGMRFRLVGGYALHRTPIGTVSLSPTLLSPPVVQQFLDRPAAYFTAKTLLGRRLVHGIRPFLQNYNVSTVIVDPIGPNPATVIKVFTEALGPPQLIGGVAAWFNLAGATAKMGHAG
jgi:hypothetical protein